MHRLGDSPEFLDGPLDPAILAGNLRDLARVNRHMGGTALSWRAIAPFFHSGSNPRALRMLDIGTGGADIPVELARRADASSKRIEVVATDVREEILGLARERVRAASIDSVSVAAAPPDRIAEPDKSFDVVHSSMVLHHLESSAAVAMLREMGRVASRAVVVNDLDRSEAWLLGARLLALLTTTNAYTRHDGPLSVRRAYRPNEVRQLAAGAGLVEAALYRARPAYRYALVFTPADD